MKGLSRQTQSVVLIWSHEHSAWWRHGAWGYSGQVTGAGLFTRDEAERLTANSGIGAHRGSVIVPLAEIERAARALVPDAADKGNTDVRAAAGSHEQGSDVRKTYANDSARDPSGYARDGESCL